MIKLSQSTELLLVRIASFIGRQITGWPLMLTAIANEMNFQATWGFASQFGVLNPVLVHIAMLMIFASGLFYVLGYRPWIAAGLFGLFLLIVTPTMHNFLIIPEPLAGQVDFRQIQLRFAEENVLLTGLVLMSFAIPRPWAWSLDEWLLRR